ncbi:hypothetical protein [Pseudosulfitobacter sp. SM2401]|uniref:hypothetical protein n=1 Tax=Pseudosulfitobacter sp. SM2401 TaxID=3350098 RepID=UPI0036F1D869
MAEGDKEKVIRAEVVANAWKDPGFLAELVANPAGVLSDAGLDVPKGTNVKVVQNTAQDVYVVAQHAEDFEETREQFMNGINWMLPLPAGVRLHMLQNTETDRHMVIPQAPNLQDMSDDDVMTMASGVGANVNNAVNVNEGANVNVGGNVNVGVNVNAGVDIAVVAIVAT